ncbi:MAG: carbonic anhydrase family protein [Pseudomonadota bacterium]|nr:carbonic anhydrase family protein [Pseudomonadota bacterium]
MSLLLSRFLQLVSLFSALFLGGLPAAQATLADTPLAMKPQSPIDIRSDNVTFVKDLPALEFNFSSNTALDVINNGSPDAEKTVRANVPVGAGTLTLFGHEWDLVQFHFHTPSEHTLNDHASALEMHLVFGDAADQLLVVSRWIESGSFNSALDPIFSHLPQTTTDHLAVNPFDLNTLLPSSLQSFRYTGSLTTPPFTEGVRWIQLAQPLDLSQGQINAFHSLFPQGDAGDTQLLNGRVILTDVPGFTSAVPEPEIHAMLLFGLGLIGFVASRQNRWHSAKSGVLRIPTA